MFFECYCVFVLNFSSTTCSTLIESHPGLSSANFSTTPHQCSTLPRPHSPPNIDYIFSFFCLWEDFSARSFREGAGWRSDIFFCIIRQSFQRAALRDREAALYDTVSLPEIHPRTRALRGFAPTRSKTELPSLMFRVGNDLSQRS